ncbi:MAG: hypothetical protein JWL85_753 [Candidatus Saccharibacteria bacterium]|nr:hypothetical protein [Candidatus Saccharibacteria bacterium]
MTNIKIEQTTHQETIPVTFTQQELVEQGYDEQAARSHPAVERQLFTTEELVEQGYDRLTAENHPGNRDREKNREDRALVDGIALASTALQVTVNRDGVVLTPDERTDIQDRRTERVSGNR